MSPTFSSSKVGVSSKQSMAHGHRYKLSDPSKAYDPSGVRDNGLEGQWKGHSEVY